MDSRSSTSSSDAPPSWGEGRLPWAALTALLLLGALELGTRALLASDHLDPATWRELYPAYDGGFDGLPVCHAFRKQRVCGPTPYLNVASDSFPRKKERGELRLFTIGASVARGRGGSYSQALERALEGQVPGRTARVVNLAANGIGATRQRLLLEEALRYDADLVLLHPHGSNEYEDERDAAYRDELHAGLGGLGLHSRFVVMSKRWLEERFALTLPAKAAKDEAGNERAASRDPATVARYQATLERELRAMIAAARAKGVQVVLIGRADRGGQGADAARVNALLASLAGEGVAFFDLEAALAELPAKERDALFKDTVHLTVEGGRLVAAKLRPTVLATLATR